MSSLKNVRAALAGSFDSVGFSRKAGCFVAKRVFFYTHGATADGYAAAVKRALPGAVVREANEFWKSWPAESYFEVRFTVENR